MNGYNMEWKDCFGRELKKGDDIIFAINGDWNQPELHTGIVINMNNDNFYITYNCWDKGEEHIYDIKLYPFEYEDGIIKCVYKLNR